MSNPFSGQQFLQQGIGTQSLAQGSSPFLANNGNPNTVYNTTPPQGGYLPPVSNAYDQWRINPLGGYGVSPFGPLAVAPALPFPLPNFGGGIGGGGGTGGGWVSNPGGGGGGGTPPTDGTQAPTGSGSNGNLYPVGSGGWMLGGPTPTFATGGGSLNTSYSNPGFGFGLTAPQFAGAWNIGSGTPSGVFSGLPTTGIGGWIRNPTGWGGNLLDALIPGDAIQGGIWNPGNVIAGTLDQTLFGGLPITENLGSRLALNRMLNNPDGWLATSDSNIAQGLRQWAALNGMERIGGADTYRQLIEAIRSNSGNVGSILQQMQERLSSMSPNEGIRFNEDTAMLQAAREALAGIQNPRAIYASQGVAGLARAGYTPAQIQQISASAGGPGVGLGAAGAFTSGAVTTVLQGDAARGAFEAMRNSQRTGVMQRHDRLN